MSVHEQILSVYENYLAENEKFSGKGVKSSAAKARKALSDLSKLCKARRVEILDSSKL